MGTDTPKATTGPPPLATSEREAFTQWLSSYNES